jgi:protein subunit release factor A
MDMTPEARMARAVKIVREQRDPNGEYAVLQTVPDTVVEAMAVEQLERLQQAVMGELPDNFTVISEEDLIVSWYRPEGASPIDDPVGVSVTHKPSGITVRRDQQPSRLANADAAMRELRQELQARSL